MISNFDDCIRLETAFWHRYPQLHQISTGFLEHLNNSLRQRLKERVGDLVLKAWACVEIVKHECRSKGIDDFKAVLDRDTSRLLRVACTDTHSFLEDFFDEQSNTTLHSLFSLYTLAAGVIATGIGLTRKHKQDFSRRHMTNFSSYAKKKINEVCASCIQQRVKMDESNMQQDSRAPPSHQTHSLVGFSRDKIIGSLFGDMSSLNQHLKGLVRKLVNENDFAKYGGAIKLHDSTQRILSGQTELDFAAYLSENQCFLEVVTPVGGDMDDFILLSFCAHMCVSLSEIILTTGKILLVCSCTNNDSHGSYNSARQRSLIFNCVSMMTDVFNWCYGVRCECGKLECAGRIRIEVMKMLTIIGSALFLMDMVWVCTASDDFVLRGVGEGTGQRPSGLLVEACRLNIITPEGFVGVVANTLKPSQFSTMYFQHGDLTLANQRCSILKCIAELLILKSKELELDLDIDIQEGSWLFDPAVKRTIKASIAPDLAILIDQVVSTSSSDS